MSSPKLDIPAELRELSQWVCWRYVSRNGNKPTKVPYTPAGASADSTDRDTWSDYSLCQQAAGFDGTGFVVTEQDPFCGIDLDGCISDGVLTPAAAATVKHFNSYTELTPSGCGLRIWIRGVKNHTRCRRKHVEIYDRERFFTMTGTHLDGTPTTIEPRQAELDAFCREVFGSERKPDAKPTAKPTSPDISDAALIERAERAINGKKFYTLWSGDTTGYASPSEADAALCALLAFQTGRDPERIDRLFRQSGLMREKWERQDYRERTIAGACEVCHDTYTPPAGEKTVPAAEAGPPPEAEEPLPEPDDADAEPEQSRFTLEELLRGELEPVQWVVDKLIPAHGVTIIGGDSGVGKSWLCYHLALAAAAGIPFLGKFPTRQTPVAVFDAESGPQLITRRAKKLFSGLLIDDYRVPSDLPITIFAGPLRLDKPKETQRLIEYLKRESVGLVIADPLIHSLPAGADENNSAAMAQFFETVRYVMGETGCTFVFTHHSRKRSHLASSDAGQMLRGSSAIRGILDSHLFIRALRPGALLCEHDKSRHAESVGSFTVTITDPDEQSTCVRFGADAQDAADQTAVATAFVERVLTDAGGSLPRKTILSMAEGEELKSRTVIRALSEAVEAGTLTKSQVGKEAHYSLTVEGGL